jgi:hypothetical protein
MLYSEYEKILKKGKRVEWYETEVPLDLITPLVKMMAEGIFDQINKLEMLGVDKPERKNYILNLWTNVRLLPYKMNGDFYLIKKNEIEGKKRVETKKEETIVENKRIVEEVVTSRRVTKNSKLIFKKK